MPEHPIPVNLAAAFARIPDCWHPHIVGQVNDCHVKLVKLAGEFVWHAHEREDELFLVVRGRLRMRFRHGDAVVESGEFIVVPRGVEHCPMADEETHVLLFEPAATVNTGTAGGERTRAAEWL
jgi:mannose-6-phosphate isomerase-like protein (cupin superfamily)